MTNKWFFILVIIFTIIFIFLVMNKNEKTPSDVVINRYGENIQIIDMVDMNNKQTVIFMKERGSIRWALVKNEWYGWKLVESYSIPQGIPKGHNITLYQSGLYGLKHRLFIGEINEDVFSIKINNDNANVFKENFWYKIYNNADISEVINVEVLDREVNILDIIGTPQADSNISKNVCLGTFL